jgi:peptidyl-prolyl cis-trans isomerase D
MAARLQQEKYVLSKIKSTLTVSDQDARQWYDDHQKQLTMPERRKVRHVFLATLDRDSGQVKSTLLKHFAMLKGGKINFSSLAATISEDEQSKVKGGDLGWVQPSRLPTDFATSVFALPTNPPTLIQTKLGWHIVEVTAIKPPEVPTFESVKEEISAAIADSRRADAIRQYRHQLRLLNHKHVEIFPQVIQGSLKK